MIQTQPVGRETRMKASSTLLVTVQKTLGEKTKFFCHACTEFWGASFEGDPATCAMCEWKRKNPTLAARVTTERQWKGIAEKMLDKLFPKRPPNPQWLALQSLVQGVKGGSSLLKPKRSRR